MEKKIVKRSPEIFSIMAAKYNLDAEKFKQTIKATVMRPGKDGRIASDEEVAAFLIVANKYDLDPFTNEIYAYPAKKGGIIPVIGIDGFVRKICNHKDFDGMEIDFSENTSIPEGGKVCPEWCEIKLYRKGVERPVVVREYLDEVYREPFKGINQQGKEYTILGPWQTHTKRMLRHKTIIQTGRVAGFMVGVYDPDEAERIIEAEIAEQPQITKKPEVTMPQEKKENGGNGAPVQDPMSTPAQQKAIHTLAGKIWGKDDDQKLFELMIKDYKGTESTKDLTLKEASALIEQLSKQTNGKK